MNIRDGNEVIAKFLGYEYVSSKSPAHNKAEVFGYGHGYWQKSTKVTLPDGNTVYFPTTKPTPKLHYHDDWNDLLSVVKIIEALPHYNAAFVIGRDVCQLHTCHPEDKVKDLHTHILVEKTDSDGKRKALWNCVVLFCRYYRGDFNGTQTS